MCATQYSSYIKGEQADHTIQPGPLKSCQQERQQPHCPLQLPKRVQYQRNTTHAHKYLEPRQGEGQDHIYATLEPPGVAPGKRETFAPTTDTRAVLPRRSKRVRTRPYKFNDYAMTYPNLVVRSIYRCYEY